MYSCRTLVFNWYINLHCKTECKAAQNMFRSCLAEFWKCNKCKIYVCSPCYFRCQCILAQQSMLENIFWGCIIPDICQYHQQVMAIGQDVKKWLVTFVAEFLGAPPEIPLRKSIKNQIISWALTQHRIKFRIVSNIFLQAVMLTNQQNPIWTSWVQHKVIHIG